MFNKKYHIFSYMQDCHIQRVGSTEDIKKRLSNYKTDLNRKRKTCKISKHFVEQPQQWTNFLFKPIVKILTIPRQKKERRLKLKIFEGLLQVKLCTLEPHGMNSINELEVNLKHGGKNLFAPDNL